MAKFNPVKGGVTSTTPAIDDGQLLINPTTKRVYVDSATDENSTVTRNLMYGDAYVNASASGNVITLTTAAGNTKQVSVTSEGGQQVAYTAAPPLAIEGNEISIMQNSKTQDGYIPASGTNNANKVWGTDASGNPGWMTAPSTYTLPKASSTTLGGVKIGNNIDVDSNGVISTHSPYTLSPATSSAIGGVKPGTGMEVTSDGTLNCTVTDTNTIYTAANGGGLSLSSDNAFSVAGTGTQTGFFGQSANITGNDGATVNIPYFNVNDKGQITSISNKVYTAKDTTYSDMSGATSSADGASGLVPAPSAGDQNKFLSGAGTWVAPAEGTVYTGTAPITVSGSAISHNTSGATAGSYGPASNVTGTGGNEVTIPYITIDNKGHVTAASNKTYKSQNDTYTAASGGGLSLSSNAFSLANSGVTAGTYGPTANVTGSNGTTIKVPQIKVDAKGRVTSAQDFTYTSVDNNTTYSGTAPISVSGSTISIAAASGSAAGSLSAADYKKLQQLSFGNNSFSLSAFANGSSTYPQYKLLVTNAGNIRLDQQASASATATNRYVMFEDTIKELYVGTESSPSSGSLTYSCYETSIIIPMLKSTNGTAQSSSHDYMIKLLQFNLSGVTFPSTSPIGDGYVGVKDGTTWSYRVFSKPFTENPYMIGHAIRDRNDHGLRAMFGVPLDNGTPSNAKTKEQLDFRIISDEAISTGISFTLFVALCGAA